jgi:hypothetical protein
MRKIAHFLLVFSIWYLVFGMNAKYVNAKTIEKVTPTIASVTATIMPTVAVKQESGNITEPRSEKTNYRLESVLEKKKIEKWNGINTLRIIEKLAIERGVSANTLILLLLLPLIATLVSVLHYIFGLSGYGIFMPTMIAVTFLATGVFGGLLLFAMILMISLLSNLFLKKLKIHFWPARSINLLFISLATFGLMIGSSFIKLIDIRNISIFPILFMIMLAEEFVRTQLVKSKNEAQKLTIGTLVLSIIGALTMNIRWVQEMVLLNPELVVLLVLALNLIVGNYTGIRMSEIKRFKKAIRNKIVDRRF